MKKSRKWVLWLLAVLMVLGTVPGETFGASGQYDLRKNAYIDVKSTPKGKTGETATVHMIFTNNSSEDLNGVAVMFDSLVAEEEYEAQNSDDDDDDDSDKSYSGEVFPFEITSSTFDAKILGSVKSGSSRNFSLSARVRRDIQEGYYTVPLEVKIRGSHASYEKVNIWITKSTDTAETGEDSSDIHFELGENQNTPSGTYPEVMNFNMNVRNSSAITAFDVNIRMGLDSDSSKFPFDINDGNYTRHFDRIGGGESVEVPYSMAIRKDTYSGYYPIAFTIEFKDSTEGDIQKAEEVFYVNVNNKDKEEETGEFNENDRTRARIIVDGFQTNPETVYAGEEFELLLHMKNASESVPASNILLNLESEKVSDSAVFTTDSGASSIVVNSLGAGQTADVSMKLRAGAWVDQKAYTITINEKYDSPEFKNAEEKVSVAIPVKQVARINTGTIEVMPDSISVGSETNVMFPINNTGKVLLYNVTASFQGDSISPSESYVGNIKPGETGNVDVMLTGAAPTMDDGKIKIFITYEDENGVVSQPVEKEMNLTVTEDIPMDFGEGDMGEMPADAGPSGFVKWRPFIIAAAAAAAAGIAGTVFAVKKRRKKKVAEEEEIEGEETDHEI